MPDKNYGSAPDILGIGGKVIVAAAIPISLAARANKKKAQLYMNQEKAIIIPTAKGSVSLNTIGIRINL